MTDREGHRWLGYETVNRSQFVAVCSCGWRSAPQRTAGLAGALLDAHREAASDAPDADAAGNADSADAEASDADAGDLTERVG